jgi:hypothetical protein
VSQRTPLANHPRTMMKEEEEEKEKWRKDEEGA